MEKGSVDLIYNDFITKVKLQDSRNEFGELDRVEDFDIPIILHDFYKYANPIDVEVTQEDFTSIKFYPASSLLNLQNEYDLPRDTFVFASREGDPILLKGEKVYTAVHGVEKWDPKLLANSFDEFLGMLIS